MVVADWLLVMRMQADTGSWLLAVMLNLWCLPHAASVQQELQTSDGVLPGHEISVEVIFPFHAALRSAGKTILRQEASGRSTAASSQPWKSVDMAGMVQLVSEALRSDCRCDIFFFCEIEKGLSFTDCVINDGF